MSQTDDLDTTVEAPAYGPVMTWMKTPANITRGWLLLSVGFGFVFLGCAIFAAVQTVRLDNRVTRDQIADSVQNAITACEATNARRAEARIIAEESAEADRVARLSDLAAVRGERDIWRSIDDFLEDGIPEPIRSTIFNGLDEREDGVVAQQEAIDRRLARIDTAYAPSLCEAVATVATTVP